MRRELTDLIESLKTAKLVQMRNSDKLHQHWIRVTLINNPCSDHYCSQFSAVSTANIKCTFLTGLRGHQDWTRDKVVLLTLVYSWWSLWSSKTRSDFWGDALHLCTHLHNSPASWASVIWLLTWGPACRDWAARGPSAPPGTRDYTCHWCRSVEWTG